MRNMKNPKFPCRICTKNVHDKDKAVQCDLCELWIHIKCNNLNYLDYRYLQNCDESWYYIECCSTIFPFNSLSSKKVMACTNTDSNIIQFSNATPENSNDPEKFSSSKYYDIEEMHKFEIPHNKSLYLFHISACSLNKNFDDLQHLLNCTKKTLI